MGFKGWLLAENIIVKWFNDIATLVPAEGPKMDIHYQWENGYSSYYVGCYQAKREGYVSLSNRPTHIAIIKTNSIEQNEGIDIGFIKNLTAILQQQGFRDVPHKEGGESGFEQLFKAVGYEPEKPPEEDFATNQVPDFEKGSKNTTPIGKAVSVSKAGGSWSFIVEDQDSYNYKINAIIKAMQQASKPLIDNDLIDYFEVVDRKSGKRLEIMYSKKGEADKNDWRSQFDKAAAQLKYFAVTHLVGMPKFKTELLKVINADDLKGGAEWPAKKVQPQNLNVSLEELYKLNDSSYSSNILIDIFLDAVKANDKYKFIQLERLADWAERKQKDTVGQKYPPWYMGGGADWIRNIWNKSSIIEEMTSPGSVLDVLSTVDSFLKYGDLLNDVEPEYYNHIKKGIKEAIEEAFSSDSEPPHLSRSDIHYLNDIAGKLKLSPSLISGFEQLSKKYKDEETTEKKRQEELRVKRSYLLPDGTAVYMMLGEDSEFQSAYKYVNYHNDLNTQELAYDLVGDEEGVHMDAYEKAEEEAYGDVLERPSESYGEDKKEVIEDIGYEWEDFMNSNSDLASDVEDYHSDEDVVKKIIDDYYDEFVEWKKAEMKEKEDKDGRYEADLESHDFQQRAGELMEEISEEYAFEKGLVTVFRSDYGLVEVQIHKKNWEKFKPILKKLLELNLHERDAEDEAFFKVSTKISVDFRPEGGFTKSVYDLRNEL